MVNFPYSELEISKPQSDPKKVVSVLEEHHRVPMKNSSRSNFASWFLFTHFVLQMWPCIVGRFGERDHFQGEFLLMSNIAPYWKHWPWEEKLIKPANQQKNASIHEDNGEVFGVLADSWRQKPIWASAHHEARHKRVQANSREKKNRLPNCFQNTIPKSKNLEWDLAAIVIFFLAKYTNWGNQVIHSCREFLGRASWIPQAHTAGASFFNLL